MGHHGDPNVLLSHDEPFRRQPADPQPVRRNQLASALLRHCDHPFHYSPSFHCHFGRNAWLLCIRKGLPIRHHVQPAQLGHPIHFGKMLLRPHDHWQLRPGRSAYFLRGRELCILQVIHITRWNF